MLFDLGNVFLTAKLSYDVQRQMAMNQMTRQQVDWYSSQRLHTPNTSWKALLEQAAERRMMQATKADREALAEKRRKLLANDGWADCL